jgi:AraC family transcriptional regulator
MANGNHTSLFSVAHPFPEKNMRISHANGGQPNAPRFPDGSRALVAPTRESAVSLTRFAPEIIGDGVEVIMPAEDAFIVLYQLREHPAHDFWLDGKFVPADGAPRATTFALSLAADPRALITEPFDKLMFHCPRAALDEIAEEAGACKVGALTAPQGWQTKDPVLEQAERLIVKMLEEPERSSKLFIDYMLLGLNAHFAHAYGGMRPIKAPRQGGLAPWQEKRAKELIAANLMKEISLQDVAGECGLSVSYFSRAFKASTKQTPHGWLQRCRIERARDLLQRPDLSLGEIAIACGFADQSHFTRTFTHHIGSTPGLWRRLRLTG